MDLSNETIKDLFYKQIRDLTLRSLDSFDLQFSGKLLEKWGDSYGRRIRTSRTINYGKNGTAPNILGQNESIKYQQIVNLIQPTSDSSESSKYIQELNDLLSNASTGQNQSYQLPQLYQTTVNNNSWRTNQEITRVVYQSLESKLKNAPDALHKDDVAIAILTTIALNQGVKFNSLNKFYDAQSNLIRQLRELFDDKNYTNNQIHNAFKGLLKEKYVAQGYREPDTLVLAATSKIDQYLK